MSEQANERRRRRDRLKKGEGENKLASKLRDNMSCRFPLCPCRQRYTIESAHKKHTGMGGNPTGDRNTTAGLMTVCAWRHRLGKVSFDRGTLKWHELETGKGADGPVIWLVNVSVVPGWMYPPGGEWVEVARELTPGVWETTYPWQGMLLRRLAEMDI
jgi:hypothetical protein